MADKPHPRLPLHPLIQELVSRRKAKRWSQVKLAKKSGHSVASISKMEQGYGHPTFLTLVDVTQALGCSLITNPLPPIYINGVRAEYDDPRLAAIVARLV